jgi:oxygen-independent coproporphyrinogen-3 oxidase
MISLELMKKYDVPAPRYTSYPTVPYWDASPTTVQWITELKKAFADPQATWAMYLHLPFCETLCTFCGCNTSITKDHKREEGYIDLIHREFALYKEQLGSEAFTKPLEELHLGGGTPTFFSSENLHRLLAPLLEQTNKSAKIEQSIEIDPRRTNVEQLKVLRSLGFNRVSMGVQDFDPEVQRLVNRIQPFEMTKNLTESSRDLGYDSVNFDLIYGLPKQTLGSIDATIKKTIELRPDRIALYSYAHVPWIKPAQRLFTEMDLPVAAEKRQLYDLARQSLLSAGYVEIGMDHFALKTDGLYIADKEKTLHRNFMGYTSRRTDILLGLGVSSISEAPTCFHQNEKVLPIYERRIGVKEIPTLRGHLLTTEDIEAREQILELMTKWRTELKAHQEEDIKIFLKPLIDDGFVTIESKTLSITTEGRPFLRNACMALDRRLRAKAPQAKIFSQAL